MVKKKAARKPAKRKASKRKPAKVPRIDLAAHPGWVVRKYPDYVAHAHVTGPFTSTRELQSNGRTITIATTYEITIDGKPMPLHMMVDNDGQLWTHLCPYATFATATELVAYVLEHAPDALTGIPGHDPDGHHDHDHHDHGGHA